MSILECLNSKEWLKIIDMSIDEAMNKQTYGWAAIELLY